MPIREYLCPQGHKTEELIFGQEYPKEMDCPKCTKPSKVVPSVSSFFLPWAAAALTAKEVWEGTALEGSDGVNPTSYRSDKPFVDMAK